MSEKCIAWTYGWPWSHTLFTTMQNKQSKGKKVKKKKDFLPYCLFLKKHNRNTRYHTCYYFRSPNYIINSVSSLLGKTVAFKHRPALTKLHSSSRDSYHVFWGEPWAQVTPAQLHNNVHCNLAVLHLHQWRQPFVQPHLISSLHECDAWGRVLHTGVHGWISEEDAWCVFFWSFSHPHWEGHGRDGDFSKHVPQTCPLWFAARSTRCLRAAAVGGMLSRERQHLAKRSFLAELTLLRMLVLLYRSTM